jgi:hypothetical protein
MRLQLCSMDSDSSGLCLVDSGSLWLVIMPKSEDQFVERPTVQWFDEWVKEWTLLRTTRNRCRDKLEESIEKPCKDVLAHRTN